MSMKRKLSIIKKDVIHSKKVSIYFKIQDEINLNNKNKNDK